MPDYHPLLILQSQRVGKYDGDLQVIFDHGIWDSFGSRITMRAAPVLAIVPLGVAVCVVICRLLWPFRYKLPDWSRPFIQDSVKQRETAETNKISLLSRQYMVLGILVAAGLAMQIVSVFVPVLALLSIPLAMCWALSLVLVALDRPKTVPYGALILITTVMVTQLTVLIGSRSQLSLGNLPLGLATIFAVFAIVAILNMPMRAPSFSHDEAADPFQPPTNQLRSPEDRLSLWQFMTVSWMDTLISRGKSKKLDDEDVWQLGFEFQHQMLHDSFRELKGTVVRRLLAANGLDLIITTFLGILESVANYSAPVLLQQLLRVMEDPLAPRTNAVIFAALSLMVRLFAAQSSIFSLWFCRRAYERSRGEMITMLYEKTLGRKVVGSSADLNATEKLGQGTNGSTHEPTKPSTSLGRLSNLVRSSFNRLNCFSRKKDVKKEAKKAASVGKILNLMRNDVYEVSQRFWEFQTLITTPLSLVFSTILVWKLIGWPCFLGVVTVILSQIVNVFVTKVLLGWERKRRAATDEKLNKISAFVSAIRHLRWYGWQEFWLESIMQSRHHELQLRAVTSVWRVVIAFTTQLASNMFPVVAFYAYTSLAGLPLRIDVAFPALQLFSMLESSLRDIPDLITTLLSAKIAVDRIEAFMAEPDKQGQGDSNTLGRTSLVTEDATFAWPGIDQPVLKNVTISFPQGLTVVCGKVAAGKSALLQALLGELDQVGGSVNRPAAMIGYCAQTPWLQSMSIRDNILFSFPYEEIRYKQVLEACALNPDLQSFKDGDLSNIGENGIGLSGGQKARVALARAVYSQAPILLLDDPLSALDHHTAESIVQNCFLGPLLRGRTIVLVTHRVELCRSSAVQIVQVQDGKVCKMDQDTMSKLRSDDEDNTVETSESAPPEGTDKKDAARAPDEFIEEEHREHGGVKASVYWEYIKAGKMRYWAILIVILVAFRLATVGRTWFLKEWGEAYDSPTTEVWLKTPLDSFPSPETNIQPWLIGFLIFGVVQAVMYGVSQSFMIVIIFTAGKGMFQKIMQRVTHAKFRFYDVTPVGRLMNRLTSDISIIDGNISHQFQVVAWLGIAWITNLVVIASVTPIFLIFSFALSAAFVFIFLRFLPTSQSLRRLEMVSLSPLMTNFGTLLEGLMTVRAFRVQGRFQRRLIEVVDTFQKMDHFYWSLQAWLMYRFDSLSACSTFILTMLALYTNVSPGLTAFVLTAAAQFVVVTHGLCKIYGRLQMDFVSVERVVELLHVEQEPKGTIDPPAAWPSYAGDIVFENVDIRYAPHLEPSLSDISFRIPAGSTTALLGRTGSGKSTLALSLLATILPEKGRILIDGVDISQVNTQALRHRVTFLAQDPVLFPGRMRDNLDPLTEYTDEACALVLEQICSPHGWTLDTTIEDGGKNLSQGQRQLVGLARAALRRSAIIILDEATASIDVETAMQIQRVLREQMRESTVITIAHRLEAVQDADYFIRLDKGRVIGHGTAAMGPSQDDHDENAMESSRTG